MEMNKKEKAYLYGASGHAKVIIDILSSQNITVEALFDDNASIVELLSIPVLYNADIKSPLIISIGNNKIRKQIAEKLNVEYVKAIHSSAVISPFSEIDLGSVIMQGTIVQADTRIGKHCIINTGASVDHDCAIEDYVHVSPHATLCGNVTVGEGTWIGAGTTVIQGIKIGRWCTIAAGSVVTKDIPDNVLAAGNRCKIVKKYE